MTTEVSERPPPRVLARPEHSISRQSIPTAALKVLYRLHRSGYLAYLVGGSVRDLLLGRSPKDYDIATNARPQEIRRLFRNSRVIGRRFRLVHVFFKNEIVEVATFRANPEPPEVPDDWHEAEQEAIEDAADERTRPAGFDDAQYGTPAEDARRRDFTVNALFYDIADFSVIDYVGGLDDLDRRTIRTIGDPEARFREDPVRMMRALEYAERLRFRVDPESAAAIDRCVDLINESSPPRLTYELLEGLRSGSAAGICRAWRRTGIFGRAFPALECNGENTQRVLEALDARIAGGATITDAAALGALFVAPFYEMLQGLIGDGGRIDNVELLTRLQKMLEPAATTIHVANHTIHLLHHGLFALAKMRQPPERGRQVLKLVRQEFFPVAWELYGFASTVGIADAEVHRRWAGAVARARRGELEVVVEERRQRRSRSGRRRRGRGRR